MYNEEHLAQVFPPYSRISSRPGGFNVRVKPDGAFTDIFVSDETVGMFGSSLPATIRLLEMLHREVNGMFVMHAFLLSGIDIHVLTHGALYAVQTVNRLSFFSDSVSIRGNGFLYSKYTDPATGEELLVPTGPGPVIAEVQKAWLDDVAPGWLTRYQLSRDLDMNPTEALRAMVAAPVTPAIDDFPTNLI